MERSREVDMANLQAAIPARNENSNIIQLHGKAGQFVHLLHTKRSARNAVAGCWLIFVIAGAALALPFMNELDADVPPSPGTDSDKAKKRYDQYFPAEPISGAFLVKSAESQPLVEWSGSTCAISGAFDQRAISAHVACENKSALGGGCITKHDLKAQLDEYIKTMTQDWLPLVGFDDDQVKQFQQEIMKNITSQLNQVPDITACPNPTSLTRDWMQFASDIRSEVKDKLPKYDHQVLFFDSFPTQTFNSMFLVPQVTPKVPMGLKLNVTVTIPGGQFWQLFHDQLLAEDDTISLLAVQTSSRSGKELGPASSDAKDISDVMVKLAKKAPSSLVAKASSMGTMMNTIQEGVESTMDVSMLTAPISFAILAVMVGNVRMLLVTFINLFVSVLAAIALLYPYVCGVITSTVAPAMMLAVAMAMSIDYSLFLLCRFREELNLGRSVEEAVVIAVSTSGRIVVTSGLTLMLCYLTMLTLPCAYIYSMGVAAGITVFTTVFVAITMTPTLLLSCPEFFCNDKRWGLTSKGCCCSRRESSDDGSQEASSVTSSSVASTPDSSHKVSCWAAFGEKIQKGAIIVGFVLLASLVPVGMTSLPNFKHSVGVTPMMPTTADATHVLLTLQDAFGVGAIFPTQLMLVPPKGATSTATGRAAWLQQSCNALNDLADEVAEKLKDVPKLAPFTNKAFSGPMILDGKCVTGFMSDAMDSKMVKWSNEGGPYSATVVTISYQIDPFSITGSKWIDALRDGTKNKRMEDVASWEILGVGTIQQDVAKVTFEKLPLMVAVMMAVVFVVIAIAFRSVVAPLRAVFCLTWMLVITFGLGVYTFQNGMLSFLNLSQLGQRDSGGMSWMSPTMAMPFMVGLGLDYDIFYSERVIEEWLHGHSEKDSATRGLGETANTITAAGAIMIVAYCSLLICDIPVLNEVSFLLIFGIFIDCFITTKIIIPCAMALLGGTNFWPRKHRMVANDARTFLVSEELA